MPCVEDVDPNDIRIVKITFATRTRLLAVSVYAPQAGRPTAENNDLYFKLSQTLSTMPRTEIAVVLGDYNAELHHRLPKREENVGPRRSAKDEVRTTELSNEPLENREFVTHHVLEHDLFFVGTW